MVKQRLPRAQSATLFDPVWPVQAINLDRLKFDTDNPRVAEVVGNRTAQAEIAAVLLDGEPQARELIPSFLQNGYIPTDPLVVKPGARDTFVVLEGNRRLAALQAMRQSKTPEERDAFQAKGLATVPCIIFAGTPQQELAYLGLRHLSKTKDWNTAAKAGFVERMLKSGLDLVDAGRTTNTSPNTLRQLMLTRRLFDRSVALGIELPAARAEGDILFWHLGDAVRRTRTKHYLGLVENENPLEQPELDETRLERLMTWLYGNSKLGQARVIQSIRDVPELDRCLGNGHAVAVLEAGGSLEDALDELQAAGATVVAHLERAKKSVQRGTASLSDVGPDGRAEVVQARADLERALKAFDQVILGQ